MKKKQWVGSWFLCTQRRLPVPGRACPLLLAFGGAFLLLQCSATRPANLGVSDGRLAPCPQTPNCVSTFAQDSVHGMEPIPYSGSLESARTKLLAVLRDMPRTKIIARKDTYVYVEFRTSVWRFVDDVEFLFDTENKLIHFRSASRLGKSDFGVNRDRMNRIVSRFTSKQQPED